jgi:hypothetical protein
MSAQTASVRNSGDCLRRIHVASTLLAGLVLALSCGFRAAAETAPSTLVIRPAKSGHHKTPTPAPAASKSPTENPRIKLKAPVEAAAYVNHRLRIHERQVVFQAPPAEELPIGSAPANAAPDPCAGLAEKPVGQLGINIAQPTGRLPSDPATECWNQVNRSAGPLAAMRFWPMFVYNWNATCLCHRPLYFEEINLERHGYGCPGCLQAGVSAAHFFASVPALPYLMTVDCPCECVYTLGHYRPGSCPPWRHHWPCCCY